MQPNHLHYVNNRVLKLNVGFLLSSGPGNVHDTAFDIPVIQVADDLLLNAVRGPVRLSRTKEGILAQGTLEVSLDGECYRCLEPVTQLVTITIEELFAYQHPTAAEFHLDDTGILDLAPLLRAEVLLATARGLLCRPDCKGLCPTCGANLNQTVCTCALDADDPRLAQLKRWLK